MRSPPFIPGFPTDDGGNVYVLKYVVANTKKSTFAFNLQLGYDKTVMSKRTTPETHHCKVKAPRALFIMLRFHQDSQTR